jgi:hypothetical protein
MLDEMMESGLVTLEKAKVLQCGRHARQSHAASQGIC